MPPIVCGGRGRYVCVRMEKVRINEVCIIEFGQLCVCVCVCECEV